MRVPDLEALRPGDFVKVRGNGNPVHTGGRAVLVAVHREDGPPWRIVALDLRYSARGAAVRVDVAGGGELARWDTPWAPEHHVEETPHHELLAPGAAHVEPRGSRRRLVVAGLVVLAVAGVLATWEHQRTPPNPVVVQRALQEGVRGTGSPDGEPPSQTPTANPSTTATQVPAAATVVAWSAGPLPVVAGLDGTTAPRTLAGVVPAEGCRDAYVRDLFSYLPIGQRVDVAGAGWFRTDDGLDVNEELVRQGVATPDATTAGSTPLDTEHLRTVQRLAADAPAC